MNIDRHNYEEFFILYMDNELSSEDRRQVELFVEANPDLKEELETLQQVQFAPDDTVTFDSKESLVRFTDCDITISNYDEWLVLYIDNELTLKQRLIVESFVMNHSVAKADLELLKKTKLQPADAIVFPDKESLYRKEEKTRRVVVMRWWRIAAAAVLLLAVATGGSLVINNNTTTSGTAYGGPTENRDSNSGNIPTANTNGSKTSRTNSTDEIKQPVASEEKNSDVAVRATDKRDNNNPVVKVNNVDQHTTINNNTQPTPDVAVTTSNTTNTGNNLPDPSKNPNMNGRIQNMASLDENNTSTAALTDLKQIDATLAVTRTTPGTLKPIEDGNEVEQPEKKNKLRGFFRTIARTIEKKTNIKTTDDQNRLLIGGLAIKL